MFSIFYCLKYYHLRLLLNCVMKDSDEINKEIKSSKNTPKRRSLDQSVEEEVTSDLKRDRKSVV